MNNLVIDVCTEAFCPIHTCYKAAVILNLCVLESTLGPRMLSIPSTKSSHRILVKVPVWCSIVWSIRELALLTVSSLCNSLPSFHSQHVWVPVLWTVQINLAPGNGLLGCWQYVGEVGQRVSSDVGFSWGCCSFHCFQYLQQSLFLPYVYSANPK